MTDSRFCLVVGLPFVCLRLTPSFAFDPPMKTPDPTEPIRRSESLMTRVDGLLDHAERLAITSVSVAEYYSGVLGELADILQAVGVAVWSVRDNGVSLFFDTDATPEWDWKSRAVEPIGRVEAEQTVIVPAEVGGRLPNPTEFVRCITCQSVAPGLRLALDVRLSSLAPRDEKVAEVVTAIAGVVIEFHRGRQLARMMSLITERDRLASLCYALHASLDSQRIALEIANDGAAALNVDRVSVLLLCGDSFRLEAATAVSEVNRRANASRAIEKLVAELRGVEKSLPWTAKSSLEPTSNASVAEGSLVNSTKDSAVNADVAQIAQSYLQESSATRIRVEPLGPLPGLWTAANAVVVFESFGSDGVTAEFDGIPEVCRHAAVAFAHAKTLEEQRLGSWVQKWKTAATTQRTRTIAGVFCGLLLLLVVIPARFELEAHGQVQPVRRQHIYAPADGLVTKVSVTNAKQVIANEELVVLRNQELDLEEQRIRGEIATSSSRLASVRAARVDRPAATSAGQLAAEEEELKQAINSLNRQLEIISRRVAELTLRSPIAGQVVRWDLIRSLEARPVRQGQLLMQVIDIHGPWQIELRIPDRSVRHVLAAQAASKDGLDVRFLFRMAPSITYAGKLGTVNLATDLDQEGELSTLATVPLSQHDIPDLRPGSSVIAKIQCGRRPIGYVWLREFFEFLQMRVFF